MQFVLDKQEQWSWRGLQVAIGAVVATALLSVAHGVLEGQMRPVMTDMSSFYMLATWCADFRYLFDQLILAGAVVFVGGKFIETRSIFTVGFDKLDTAKVSMKGPDDDNIVWIGHRYGSRMEAEMVATTIESRMKESME